MTSTYLRNVRELRTNGMVYPMMMSRRRRRHRRVRVSRKQADEELRFMIMTFVSISAKLMRPRENDLPASLSFIRAKRELREGF